VERKAGGAQSQALSWCRTPPATDGPRSRPSVRRLRRLCRHARPGAGSSGVYAFSTVEVSTRGSTTCPRAGHAFAVLEVEPLGRHLPSPPLDGPEVKYASDVPRAHRRHGRCSNTPDKVSDAGVRTTARLGTIAANQSFKTIAVNNSPCEHARFKLSDTLASIPRPRRLWRFNRFGLGRGRLDRAIESDPRGACWPQLDGRAPTGDYPRFA